MSNLSTQTMPQELLNSILQDDGVQRAIREALAKRIADRKGDYFDNLVGEKAFAEATEEVYGMPPDESAGRGEEPFHGPLTLDKWGYAILAGTLCLAYAYSTDPQRGGLEFALGFLLTFLGLTALEMFVNRSFATKGQ